jgi:hypothetical protein
MLPRRYTAKASEMRGSEKKGLLMRFYDNFCRCLLLVILHSARLFYVIPFKTVDFSRKGLDFRIKSGEGGDMTANSARTMI